jgi:hypothetical protein
MFVLDAADCSHQPKGFAQALVHLGAVAIEATEWDAEILQELRASPLGDRPCEKKIGCAGPQSLWKILLPSLVVISGTIVIPLALDE